MNNESKKHTPALPNADTRRGGKNPSCAGLTSCTSPEVQSHQTENSHTGVSLDCVPSGKKVWYVFRATYGRTALACVEIQKKDIETYIPMTVVKKRNKWEEEAYQPLLPNLIFAYMTYEQSLEFVKEPARTASYIKYYTDKTKPIVEETGLNPPMIIPDNEMKNFVNATSVPSEHSGMIPKERVHYKSGELVRVIKGDFTGVIGRVARASGQQRIAIDIDGLGTFVTAYIPNDFIQEWSFKDNL